MAICNARGRWQAAVLLTLALALIAATLTATADIELVDLDPYRDTGVTGDAYRAGFMAAMEGKKVGTDNIVFIPRNADEALADIDTILTRVLQDHPDVLAVTGAIGIEPVQAMASSAVAVDSNLVALGSFSPLASPDEFSRQLFMYDLSAATKGVSLLFFAMMHLQMHSHAIFYSSDMGVSRALVLLFQSIAQQAGQPLTVVYDHSTGADFSAEKTEAVIAAKPQVIYVNAISDAALTQFLRTVWQDSRTAKTKILTVDSMQPYFEAVIPLLKSQYGIELEPGQVILASSTAASTDMQLTHVQQFHDEMGAYITAGSTTAFTDATILDTDPTIATEMLTGWVRGTATLATLRSSAHLDDRAEFQNGLFNQRRIQAAGDLLYGTYSDTCGADGEELGWACECNQGSRVVYYRQLDENAKVTTLDGGLERLKFDSDACYLTKKAPRFSYANALLFKFADEALADLAFVGDYFDNLYASATDLHSVTHYTVVHTTLDTLQADYDAYVATHKVDLVIGLIPDPNFDPRDAVLLNPFPHRPTVQKHADNRLHVSPTAEQQIYLFYAFLASEGSDTIQPLTTEAVTVVLKDIIETETQQYTDFFKKSAATFDMEDPTMHSIDENTAVTTELASKGYNYVIGINFGDAEHIANYLESNPDAVVVLLYDDFATYYRELMRVLREKPASVQARLLSMTNFPLWSDTSAAAEADSQLLAAFHAAQPSAYNRTPRHLCVFATAYVLRDVINAVKGDVFSPLTIATALYRDTYRYAEDLRIGPFKTCNATLDNAMTSSEDCTSRNFGAFEVSILSAQRALDPTQPPNMPSTQPALVYKDRPKRLSKGAIAGIVVGCVAAAAIITAIIIIVCCCCIKNARDNKNAPKDPNEPVTIMFTDIESSTALWAHIPTIMPDAVAKHHSVIRGTIAAYMCYEVKTIGDSFMIACKDATTATQLAVAIQAALLAADYGTDEIDAAYREMELEREANDEDQLYKAHTARLPDDTYASMWGGLRVRVGIHTGTCDVRYDEVSKGYDYYGETVNMAARTEAIGNGGQIIVTEATWDALSDDAKSELHHNALGPVELRGVPQPVSMVQVDAIGGRRFAALRTEIDAALPDDDGDVNSSAMMTGTSGMNVASILISNVLKTLLAPFMPTQRAKEMKPFLSRWGIAIPSKPPSVTVNDYNTFLTNRLAVKVSAVYQKAHGRTPNSLDTRSLGGSATGTADLVQIALNQLPSRRMSEGDYGETSLPRVFIDEPNGSLHDARRGSRSLLQRLLKHLTPVDTSICASDKVVFVGTQRNNASARSNVTFVSEFSQVSTLSDNDDDGVTFARRVGDNERQRLVSRQYTGQTVRGPPSEKDTQMKSLSKGGDSDERQ